MSEMREIDCLISEKVFNIEAKALPESCFSPGRNVRTIENGHEVPRYSTDISAAWLVVENLRKRDIIIRVIPTQSGYHCKWSRFGDAEKTITGIEPTAPLSICMATLVAMEKIDELSSN